MTTRPYVARQGDCLTSLAARHGVTEDDLRSHQANSDLSDRRSDPNVLGAGDVVHVPAHPPERPRISSGGTHRFKAYGATTPLKLDIQDPSGEKMTGKPYRLRVGTRVIEGNTDGDGRVEARVPTSARVAELTIWPGSSRDEHAGVTWTLRIGHLDPEDGRSGISGRLENLGIPVRAGPAGLESALRTFQQLAGLPVTGTLDDATRDALRSAAGA